MTNHTHKETAAVALSLLDLTNLKDDCTEAQIDALCERAQTPFGNSAAICIWPRFVARARTVLGMIKSGLVSGLSIGFKTKASTQQGRNRVISALDLYEISVVRNPAHPRARITSAKTYDVALAMAAIIRRFAAASNPN